MKDCWIEAEAATVEKVEHSLACLTPLSSQILMIGSPGYGGGVPGEAGAGLRGRGGGAGGGAAGVQHRVGICVRGGGRLQAGGGRGVRAARVRSPARAARLLAGGQVTGTVLESCNVLTHCPARLGPRRRRSAACSHATPAGT